jgi:hypothetical protein
MRGLRKGVDPSGLPGLEGHEPLEGRDQSISTLYWRQVWQKQTRLDSFEDLLFGIEL